jgi:hypothetical protein
VLAPPTETTPSTLRFNRDQPPTDFSSYLQYNPTEIFYRVVIIVLLLVNLFTILQKLAQIIQTRREKKRILKEKLKKILAEKEEKTVDLIDRSDRSNVRVSG